ncbi:ATP-binding protein (plasmid) [Kitasatospora sp. NBC_00070]|uniref:ATP-binding protein n=1 Tax=Kitasatospora sp. NBC_00070 TaxID=2975962 RepID=UPI002F90BA12
MDTLAFPQSPVPTPYEGAPNRRPTTAWYARHAVERQLGRWGLTAASERAAVLLIVSELVTNACRHSDGLCGLRTSWHDHVVTIEVDDSGQQDPAIVPPTRRGAAGGYGMDLVDSLSESWGVRHRLDGKTVFARVPFP